DGPYGLLKFRIKSTQGEVRTRPDGEYDEETPPIAGVYLIEKANSNGYLHQSITHTTMDCEELDTIIVIRLMEHVRAIGQKREEVETYKQQVKNIRNKRQSRIKQLEKSIKDIEEEQERLTARLGQKNVKLKDKSFSEEVEEVAFSENKQQKTPSERAAELILDRIDILEEERQRLIQTIEELEREAEKDYGSLDEELEELEALWPEYTFEHRRNLINFVVKEVVLDHMSTHWVRIQVLWLNEEWGREEIFYRRRKGARKIWATEEDETLKKHYPSMPSQELMKLLPERTWQSIRLRASLYKISRPKTHPREKRVQEWDTHCSYSDILFLDEKNLTGVVQNTDWTPLHQPRSPVLNQPSSANASAVASGRFQ
ncbi:MAG TPA: hypothetical protein VGM01_02460, partial [Ktedonobacteraceae bacterium]